MLELRPVRGACFVQGGGGSDQCERVVPTLHGQARLGIRSNIEIVCPPLRECPVDPHPSSA